MGIPSASASAASMNIGGKHVRYGPINYKTRGELVRIYLEAMPDPVAKFEESLSSFTNEELQRQADKEGFATVEDWKNASLENWKLVRTAMQGPSYFESAGGDDLFLKNVGGDDERGNYTREFLFIVLSPFNKDLKYEEIDGIIDGMTKGQLREIWNMALELGPYRPKSE